MDLNKVMIIGRLTRDPELRNIPDGTPVANLSVATNRMYTDKTGNKQQTVEYHDVVMWRRLAEIAAQYLKKGAKVYLEGRLQTRTWDDPNGFKRYKTEIVAENMIMLDRPTDSGGYVSQPSPYAARPSMQQQQKSALVAPQTETSQAQEEDLPTISVDEEPKHGSDDEEISVEDIPF